MFNVSRLPPSSQVPGATPRQAPTIVPEYRAAPTTRLNCRENLNRGSHFGPSATRDEAAMDFHSRIPPRRRGYDTADDCRRGVRSEIELTDDEDDWTTVSSRRRREPRGGRRHRCASDTPSIVESINSESTKSSYSPKPMAVKHLRAWGFSREKNAKTRKNFWSNSKSAWIVQTYPTATFCVRCHVFSPGTLRFGSEPSSEKRRRGVVFRDSLKIDSCKRTIGRTSSTIYDTKRRVRAKR